MHFRLSTVFCALLALIVTLWSDPAAASDGATPNPAVSGITVKDAFVRIPPTGANVSAAFMVLQNTGNDDDALIRAESPASPRVELHTHIHEGNVMKMRPVDQIPVPAKGEASLAPGGDHLMFIGLTHPLNVGDMVTITLHFAKAGAVDITVPVRGLGHGQGRGQERGQERGQGHIPH